MLTEYVPLKAIKQQCLTNRQIAEQAEKKLDNVMGQFVDVWTSSHSAGENGWTFSNMVFIVSRFKCTVFLNLLRS